MIKLGRMPPKSNVVQIAHYEGLLSVRVKFYLLLSSSFVYRPIAWMPCTIYLRKDAINIIEKSLWSLNFTKLYRGLKFPKHVFYPPPVRLLNFEPNQ